MFRIRPDSDNKVAMEVASNQIIKRVCNQYENKQFKGYILYLSHAAWTFTFDELAVGLDAPFLTKKILMVS
jgi:hypothetical protein